MENKQLNTLILCTGNSARSILAESLINLLGSGRVHGFSAGSMPAGKVNPFAIELLADKGLPVTGLASKSWDEFAKPGAVEIDFVITVCDNAAGEVCPIWPGHPVTAHWGIPDPAGVEGTDEEKRQAFSLAYERLERRITAFMSLPLEQLDGSSLKSKLNAIGQIDD